jgi:hypothetical protein
MLLCVVFALMLAVPTVLALDLSYTGNIASGAQFDLYTVPLIAGENVVATLVCDFDGVSRPLDPVLSVYFPGSDSSDTINADVYNDDGFGLDDDPNGVDCDAFDSSRVFFSAPVTGEYTFRADGFGSSTGPYILSIHTGGGNPMLSDGRINGQQAAPIILYCDGTTVNGFDVNGQSLFSLANGDTGSGAGWSVGTAPDGRMLVMGAFPDGKAYYFAFDGCPGGHYDAFSGDPPMPFDSGSYGVGTSK